MFQPKNVRFLAPEAEDHTRAPEGSLLALDIPDKNGREYHDLDILAVYFPLEKVRYPMKGVIRYFGGRFEIVCPWKDQRFIMGLNRTHEIVGNFAKDPSQILEQFNRPFSKEGGISE